MTILLEALRQIAVQFPKHSKLIERISSEISRMINSGREINLKGSRIKSKEADRGFIFRSIESLIDEYGYELENINNTPILAVFDSFEEMQYRASLSELYSFFNLIQSISELIPRIRPIFAGRSEIEGSYGSFEFNVIEIKSFDSKSADAFLKKSGVGKKKLRNYVFKTFGGNPLILRLAANLHKKEGLLIDDLDQLKETKIQYLVRRILGHIHDKNEKVQKIAVPGMLVRFINPTIIEKVLADPTGVGKIDREKAEEIYKELKKEVALLSDGVSEFGLLFRQDLRMACESMILKLYPSQSSNIRERAIEYFSQYHKIDNKEKRTRYWAEYIYHQLKVGTLPKGLTRKVYQPLRPYLDNSVIELPKESQVFLRSLTRQELEDQTLQQTSDEEWEGYQTEIIKDALNGEYNHLVEIGVALKNRPNRTNHGFSEFSKFESLLYQRINKISWSMKIIEDVTTLDPKILNQNPDLSFEFFLLKIQNLEYLQQFEKAFHFIQDNIETVYTVSNENLLAIFEILDFRIRARLGMGQNLIRNGNPPFFNSNSDKFFDTKWEFVFNTNVGSNIFFHPQKVLRETLSKLTVAISSVTDLEELAFSELNFFMKDISYTGALEILLIDYILAKESIGKILN